MKTIKAKRAKVSIAGLVLGLGLGSIGMLTHAERITVPLGQQAKAWNIDVPATGLRKDQVEQRYGMAMSTTGPVGEPPIYTWEYDNFLVYFEGDHVIHSVVKFKPEEQQ